jgi:glycosyltransferase involved in cell wall biosynthesis
MNADITAILNTVSDTQPPMPETWPDTHVNVVLPSLTYGGAERMVYDLILGLNLRGRRPPIKLFILSDTSPEYPLPDADNVSVFRLHGRPEEAKYHAIALEVLTSPTRAIFTHLIHSRWLRRLWDMGVQTIPVIHNASPGWQENPRAFTSGNVPFVVAVSEAVASELREHGCAKPTIVIRHELPYWNTIDELTHSRRQIREQYGIRDDTILIGMVGQFKPQKAYTRAVRVLSDVQQFVKAKLMILGGWDTASGAGRAAFTATCQQALDLGIMPDLLTPGAVNPVRPYFAAFDVFLNTSIYEGLSISMLEAIQAGCPVVTADAGGNREALVETSTLVADSSDITGYVDGIQRAVARKERSAPAPGPYPDMIPRLWSMFGQYGCQSAGSQGAARAGTLFVIENINFGGPQRSLCNLLAHPKLAGPAYLAILDKVCRRDYLRQLDDTNVLTMSLADAGDAVDKVEQILNLIDRFGVRSVCFWNAPANVKLLVTRVLENRKIKLVDVSPGPMYFDELEASADFQRRLSFDSRQYMARLDHFVAIYNDGLPAPKYGVRRDRVALIPIGVPATQAHDSGFSPVQIPEGLDERYLIVTSCRIAPAKRLEFLLGMMRILRTQVPEANLIVVGGVDPRHLSYWHNIAERQRSEGIDNVHFVGGHGDVRAWLRRCRLFVMVSDQQGCPNASLEALAEGLPVIANDSGGTSEQVEEGVNGFLVTGDDPAEMAQQVELLLRNPKLLDAFGRASRRIAAEKFSMDQMVESYNKLLG